MPLSPIFITFAIVLATTLASPFAASPAQPSLGQTPGTAVVELFTSEGCSSCPSADRLLAGLAAEADRTGRPIYALSFHVDYWNSLGWADPFSRPAFTERQKAYAAVLGGGVYTPEMIVNGSEAFAGSDAARARRAVDLALKKPVRTMFQHLAASVPDAATTAAPAGTPLGNVQITFKLSRAVSPIQVRLALVQPDTAVPVARGENGGRTLAHHNVVRAFATLRPGLDGAGRRLLPLPAGSEPRAFRIIAYAQDPESLEILGAAQTALTTTSGTR